MIVHASEDYCLIGKGIFYSQNCLYSSAVIDLANCCFQCIDAGMTNSSGTYYRCGSLLEYGSPVCNNPSVIASISQQVCNGAQVACECNDGNNRSQFDLAAQPTNRPTQPVPTKTPTSTPTNTPTNTPTLNPTSMPVSPTTAPTNDPTMNPTLAPTRIPTNTPTLAPSTAPTPPINPTNAPTNTISSTNDSDPSSFPRKTYLLNLMTMMIVYAMLFCM